MAFSIFGFESEVQPCHLRRTLDARLKSVPVTHTPWELGTRELSGKDREVLHLFDRRLDALLAVGEREGERGSAQ